MHETGDRRDVLAVVVTFGWSQVFAKRATAKEDDMPTPLTSNFNLEEFTCKDGTMVPAELMDNVRKLAENLQVLREELGLPITIMSGYRTPSYNQKCGGETKSQHMEARAADIIVKGMKPADVCAKVKALIEAGKLVQGGVGLYDGWVHYDVRGYKARWGGA